MADLIVIDGNSLMNRAFYGIPELKNSKGQYTNAVYGFVNILLKFINDENPVYAAVAFDLKAPTFRHKKYSEYKAGRHGMPEELASQMPVIKEVLKAMGIESLEVEGFEADDILGTLSKLAEDKGFTSTILTGDKDSLQLISDKVTVKLPTTKIKTQVLEIFNYDNFKEKYGVEPLEFIDVKALMGDKSDNIPGVPSIGDKTAIKLIKEFKSIENLYDNIEEVKATARVKENLSTYKEQAFLSKELATIVRQMEGLDIEKCKIRQSDNEVLYKLFKELEFSSFIEKLNLSSENSERREESKFTYEKIFVEDNEFAELILNVEELSYFINWITDTIYIKLNEKVYSLDINKNLDSIKKIFENNKIKKVGYDIKCDIVNLDQKGIAYNNIFFDVMIAGYVLDSTTNGYKISNLAERYLGLHIEENESIDFEYVCAIEKLKIHMEKLIKENEQDTLFNEIEMPLIEALASMEIEGFRVDIEYLDAFGKKLDEHIQELQKNIYELAGEEFNINSPKQLGVVLFERLNLKVIAKTKTGYSTNAEVLNKLLGEHEIIEHIINYRQLAKLKSTYIDGMKETVDRDNKIHSNFNQTVVATGRISSTEPNLQNIPIKLELGRLIRKAFIASDDEHILIDADYSQIELRVLADISEDEHLINAFKNKEDIHRMTAAKIFDVSEEEVTKTMRSSAKAVNFGIVYGISDFGLSRDLNISKKEAQKYIDSYFEKYPKIKDYMDDIIKFAKENEFVSTKWNRRRYIKEINSKNFMVRSGANRIAMNTPIQGTAADIIKIAMIRVYKRLKSEGLKSRLILQVHDELIIDTLKKEKEKVLNIIKEEMENVAELKVPLVADANEGETWYDAK